MKADHVAFGVVLALVAISATVGADPAPASWNKWVTRNVNPACKSSGATQTGNTISVTFAYTEKGERILDKLSFAIEGGEWACQQPVGRCTSFYHVCTDWKDGGPWPPKR